MENVKTVHPINTADVSVYWIPFNYNSKLCHLITIGLFWNFCWTLRGKGTNFTTTLGRNVLEGKVAVRLRRGPTGGKLAWTPALQHCHLLATAHIPATTCRTLPLQTKAASRRQTHFLLLLREDASPLRSSHAQWAVAPWWCSIWSVLLKE